jgi:hypothetical protein
VISSDPAWEAMKATCRSLDHDEAVQESAFLTRQFYALWGHRFPVSPVDLNLVLRDLRQKKIPFVLIGAHGFGAWTGRPRSTKDVDILVKQGRNHSRAVNLIKALYPNLDVRTLTGVTAFFIPGERESVIDIHYPHRADLHETLRNAIWTENKKKRLRYRVPSLEQALSNKYGAMITPTRPMVNRQQDLVDFSWMVKHSTDKGQRAIDSQRLEILGEKVRPGGGGKGILRLVEALKAEKPVHLDTLA